MSQTEHSAKLDQSTTGQHLQISVVDTVHYVRLDDRYNITNFKEKWTYCQNIVYILNTLSKWIFLKYTVNQFQQFRRYSPRKMLV